MNELSTEVIQSQSERLLALIEMDTQLQPRTKAQYRRAVTKAQDAGVDFLNRDSVMAYLATVPQSERSFFVGCAQTSL